MKTEFRNCWVFAVGCLIDERGFIIYIKPQNSGPVVVHDPNWGTPCTIYTCSCGTGVPGNKRCTSSLICVGEQDFNNTW